MRTKETESAKRIIIEKDSVIVEFDLEEQDPAANLIVWGTTVDGRYAIYLDDEEEFKGPIKVRQNVMQKIKDLRDQNPDVNFELCKSLSIFAPRKPEERTLALVDIIKNTLEKGFRGEIKTGHNAIKLTEWLPAANVDWNAFGP